MPVNALASISASMLIVVFSFLRSATIIKIDLGIEVYFQGMVVSREGMATVPTDFKENKDAYPP